MKSPISPSATVFFFCVGTAVSAPVYWDGSVADGLWTSANNWSDTLAPDGAGGAPTSGDVATFNATGIAASTISLNGDQAVMGLSSITSGVILQGGGTNRTLSLGTGGITVTSTSSIFTVGGGANQNVNLSLQGSQSWLFNSGGGMGTGMNIQNSVSLGLAGTHTLTLGGTQSSTSAANVINGVISDGGLDRTLNLTMNPSSSSGRWVLSGNNTYTGLTTVSNGGLTLGNINALGSTSAGTVINNGGSIFFRASIGSFAAEALTLNGNGRDDKGALRNVGGNNTWNGAITVASNTRIGSDSGILTLSNTADIGRTAGAGTRSLIFVGLGTVTHRGELAGDMSVTRGVDGTLRMEGDAKTYTGVTSISAAGTMVLDTALSGTSGVTVNGTLRGNGGSILNTSTVTVTSGGAIAPGTFVQTPLLGTLTMGTLTFDAVSTLGLDIDSGTMGSDVLNVTSLNIASGTLLTVNDIGSLPSALTMGQALLFIENSGSWNGGLFTVGGTEIQDQSTVFTVGMNSFQIDYNYSGGLGTGVALIVVPEPSAAGLTLFAFTMLAARRRRSGSPA